MDANSIFNSQPKKAETHWASISDLMSGLMVIFLFIAVAYMRNVTDENYRIKQMNYELEQMNYRIEQVNYRAEQVIVTWNQTQESLFMDLYEEFRHDLPRWQASLNRETLSLRFEEPSVLFEVGSAQITGGFKRILDDFFPRYLEILRRYSGDIAEVRIEGHTSSEWLGVSCVTEAYFRNMTIEFIKLSLIRQFAHK